MKVYYNDRTPSVFHEFRHFQDFVIVILYFYMPTTPKNERIKMVTLWQNRRRGMWTKPQIAPHYHVDVRTLNHWIQVFQETGILRKFQKVEFSRFPKKGITMKFQNLEGQKYKKLATRSSSEGKSKKIPTSPANKCGEN